MRALILMSILLFCNRPAGVRADAQDQPYPPLITQNADRVSTATKDWRRMLDAYGVADTDPDFYPITYTPRSLPGPSSGMRLTTAPASEIDEMTLMESIKAFLERWQNLLYADPASVSLVSLSTTAGVTNVYYRQVNYPYPIVGEFGSLRLSLTADGKLQKLDDTFLPAVDLSGLLTIERSAAAARVTGQTFEYSDSSGARRSISVTDSKLIKVKQIVIVPIKKDAGIEIHVAWQVSVQTTPAWTIYVDAINGQTLKTEPEMPTGNKLVSNSPCLPLTSMTQVGG